MEESFVISMNASEYTHAPAPCLFGKGPYGGRCGRRMPRQLGAPEFRPKSISTVFIALEIYTMSLTEAQFHALVDEVQTRVEDIFDDADSDIDVENAGGVLTVRFENRSQLILSRQPPLRQLWVAARSGGFHFDYDADARVWVCQGSGEPLGALLSRVAGEQGGEALDFSTI